MILGRVTTLPTWLAYISFLYFGFFTVLFFVAVMVGVGASGWHLISQRLTPKPRRVNPQDTTETVDKGRRAFVSNGVSAIALGGTSVVTGIGAVQAAMLPEVEQVDIDVKGLHPDLDGYTIAQISDVHIGPTLRKDFLHEVVKRVNAINADLVAITGDLVDGLIDELGEHVAPLKQLEGRDGVFFVTGNHEYYWDARAWKTFLEERGVQVLTNHHHVVHRQSAQLLVAGCTDYSTGAKHGEASDPALARQGAPNCDYSILLAHQPKSVFAAKKTGYDLQLSGHTHAGQYAPFSYLVGLFHPFARGLGRFGDLQLYVNRGTGYWGPPVRTGVPSEITKLVLRRT